MKRILTIFVLILSIVTLTACKSESGLVNEKLLDNFTLERTVEGKEEYSYSFIKSGFLYEYHKNNEVSYYTSFDNGSFKHIANTHADDLTYVSSESSSVVFGNITKVLKELKPSDCDNKGNGVYELKELKQNVFILPFLEDIKLDSVTNLFNAYSYGLISAKSAVLKVEKGAISNIELKFEYSNTSLTININIKDYGKSEIKNFPYEGYIDKNYNTYVEDGSAVITLEFKGYGKVEFVLLKNTELDTNTINYFIYLVKKGLYKDAHVNLSSSSVIQFGDQEKTLDKTIKAPTTSLIKNQRGTVSLCFKDSSGNSSQQLQINLKDNSSSSSYYVIGGVVSGFEILDLLSTLPNTEYEKIEVKVTIKYNNLKYTQPHFAK